MSDLNLLIQAKAESDRRNYLKKAILLRQMIQEKPEDWFIDSEKNGIYGLTHKPTHFKIHLPRTQVPETLLPTQSYTEIKTAMLKEGLQTSTPFYPLFGRPALKSIATAGLIGGGIGLGVGAYRKAKNMILGRKDESSILEPALTLGLGAAGISAGTHALSSALGQNPIADPNKYFNPANDKSV